MVGLVVVVGLGAFAAIPFASRRAGTGLRPPIAFSTWSRIGATARQPTEFQ